MSNFLEEVKDMTKKAQSCIERERIENLEKEFFKTIEKDYIPELLSYIKKEITDAAKKGERKVSIEFSKFYLHLGLHNKLSKFNDIFEDILPVNQHLNRLGLDYIKGDMEITFNYHFYIPKLINILRGHVQGEPKFIQEYTRNKESPLKGFIVTFSETGFIPNENYISYYAVEFFW